MRIENYCALCDRKLGNWKKRIKASIVGAAVLGGSFEIYRYCTSPEYLRKKELDGKAEFIIPEAGRCEEYSLPDGKIAKVSRFYEFGERLSLELNGGLTFRSEKWDCKPWDGPDGDARNLDELAIKIDEDWHWFKQKDDFNKSGEIKDYECWQKRYESLIEEIYELARVRKERVVGEELERDRQREINWSKAKEIMLKKSYEMEKNGG